MQLALLFIFYIIGIYFSTFWSDSLLTVFAAIAIALWATGRDRHILSLGLLLSLPGDFCMKASDQYSMHIFILGIVFFFMAHLCFCLYFFRHLKYKNAALMALAIFLTGYLIYMMLYLLTPMCELHKYFYIAGLAYIIISVLSLSLACGIGFKPLAKTAMILSILCIVLSDTIISWDCFVDPTNRFRVFIIPLYLMCHALLATGMIIENDTTSSPHPPKPSVNDHEAAVPKLVDSPDLMDYKYD